MHTTHTIALPNRPPLILGQRALVMGILNVTPDSFSDGGQHNLIENAVAHAQAMIADGADIIDIGGESTRPGAALVSVQEELDRVMPVIDALVAAGITTPISIDSYKPLVADQAIQAGASIINDVHGLQGAPEMAEIAALHSVPVIAMHWDKVRDEAKPIIAEMARYFETTLALAKAVGVGRERIILDPGFGFGKSLAENYEVLRELTEVQPRGMPILVGTSRKSMIGRLLDIPADERLAGTIATTVAGYLKGGHIFRVHDVRANRDALRVAQATLYGPPTELG
ncbi:dihydropteroate synthase [Devosia epidermidihirudinis]|uniref:Dihydropteroate synthase n=1 Tax=Devosia epidermidihirudinis TaxID=1293439 RepID=A0A0F5QH60_9HYPH|nr:dihydropteroate synthase [Devosia epidermidihirudinis]KKC39364.1 dihydropteroate synthase [Devosia epidermidihirudinis]